MAQEAVLEKPANYQVKRPDYDALWKKLIEELFEEFMLFFAADLYEQIDFSKMPDFLKQELYKEIIQEKKGRMIADQIVKVYLKSGEEKWILVHVEVQGKEEDDFGKRMFRYFYRIYDRFDREVYAIALLTEQQAQNQTNGFHYNFYGTKIDYTYNIYHFKESNIEKLEQSANPFAAAVIAGIYANKSKTNASKRYTFKRKLMIQTLQKFTSQQEKSRTYLSALFYFIDYLLQVPKEYSQQLKNDIIPYLGKEVAQKMRAEKTDTSQTLAEIFEEMKREGIEEGRKEGKEDGRKEGRKDSLIKVVRKLVKKGFTNDEIAEITELGTGEIAELRESF
ncbi:hypothetical protein [Lentibacillus sp. Marseille-P4043]|uniref:hypothetical protein n=1 Tax=Lentibacillus sp. Marseille-P4043 TaxID=2040293 RepID=UPI00131A4EE6|nr:hypothetical protein [Lentibacillus sp. Marseille-P4043]